MTDPRRGYITQGEYAVGGVCDPEISTILGSCVAVCLWDPEARIGGMNHILLPSGTEHGGDRFGAFEMEQLINALIKRGAARSNLEAKVFGGASMLDGLTDIGRRNAEFALQFLAAEELPVRAKSVGGTKARQVRFLPGLGLARQRFVHQKPVQPEVPKRRCANDVELF